MTLMTKIEKLFIKEKNKKTNEKLKKEIEKLPYISINSYV